MSITIAFTFTSGSPPVATNLTSAVLSDPTASFGVRRTDNNAIVVAAGTAISNPSTGVYSYTFSEPAAGLTYEYWITRVYLGVTTTTQGFVTGVTSGGLGLSDLRNYLTLSARNARDGTEYSTLRQDLALQLAFDEWNRYVKPSKRFDTITLTAGSNVLPATPTGFKPEFAITQSISLAGQMILPGINIVPYDEVLKAQARGWSDYCENNTTPTNGRPYLIGFSDVNDAVVYPIPDQNYSIGLWWWAPPTKWTPGASSSTVPSFNLDDDALRVIACTGAVYFLQRFEPENAAAAQAAHADFITNAKQFAARGAGGRGVQVIHRSPPDWMRGR